MEREIIFRGKLLDGGGWVEGCLLSFQDGEINRNRSFIIPFVGCVHYGYGSYDFGNFVEVDPVTVGQYTGRDMRGVRLFDGDIIRRDDGMVFWVAWSNTYLTWEARKVGARGSWCLDVVLSIGPCEIIGNIWDTPELLEVRK